MTCGADMLHGDVGGGEGGFKLGEFELGGGIVGGWLAAAGVQGLDFGLQRLRPAG